MDKFYLPTPDNFSFKSTLYSHGWSDLRPFKLVEKPLSLMYVLRTSQKNVNILTISELTDRKLEISIDRNLTVQEKNQILNVVKRIFRFEEDYTEFYHIAGKSKKFSWVVKYGAGRLLRSGSLWEDMVKMLCTTNCTWRLTQIMTENLVVKLGAEKKIDNSDKTMHTFPEPKDVATKSEEYLRKEIKMGYRAPFLLELAGNIMSHSIDLNKFEDPSLSPVELYQNIKKIKGFGDYAVSNLLKLLGRYNHLGADSWSSQKFSLKYYDGKPVDRKIIQSHYNHYGKWAGLFFWLEMCEDWYTKETPW